jgi:hypothetical protein
MSDQISRHRARTANFSQFVSREVPCVGRARGGASRMCSWSIWFHSKPPVQSIRRRSQLMQHAFIIRARTALALVIKARSTGDLSTWRESIGSNQGRERAAARKCTSRTLRRISRTAAFVDIRIQRGSWHAICGIDIQSSNPPEFNRSIRPPHR